MHKAFHGEPALRDVHFQVARSQLTAIIGPSGCGKSTLLRCLNGLETFDAGRVQIGGVVLQQQAGKRPAGWAAQLRRLREEVGMVFQSFNLFPHWTALQNVAKAPQVVQGKPRAEAEALAAALLAKVGLEDRLHHYPAQLSGGQQQRAAIARALAMTPRVMLYDEPTSALDPSLVQEVLQIMRQLDAEGMTQVVVTHEMRFAREAASQVLMLHRGEIIESGPPADVFDRPRDPRTREFLRSVTG